MHSRCVIGDRSGTRRLQVRRLSLVLADPRDLKQRNSTWSGSRLFRQTHFLFYPQEAEHEVPFGLSTIAAIEHRRL